MSAQEKDKTIHKNHVIESESDWQINLRTFERVGWKWRFLKPETTWNDILDTKLFCELWDNLTHHFLTVIVKPKYKKNKAMLQTNARESRCGQEEYEALYVKKVQSYYQQNAFVRMVLLTT